MTALDPWEPVCGVALVEPSVELFSSIGVFSFDGAVPVDGAGGAGGARKLERPRELVRNVMNVAFTAKLCGLKSHLQAPASISDTSINQLWHTHSQNAIFH
jgi:hypothetical protein